MTWRAAINEPARAPLTHEADTYDACLSWARGVGAVRAFAAGATITLTGPTGGRRRYSLRGGEGATVTFRQLEE